MHLHPDFLLWWEWRTQTAHQPELCPADAAFLHGHLTQSGTIHKTGNCIKDLIVHKLLSKGGSNLTLPTKGGIQDILCIRLDFVPLWLAKITITPAMEQENPELAERLIEYQLRAKDVLAAAFIPAMYGKKDREGPTAARQDRMDALKAATIIAECKTDRLNYVLAILKNVGFDVPDAKQMEPGTPNNQELPSLMDVIDIAVTEYGISMDRIAKITGISRSLIYRYRDGAKPHGKRGERITKAILREIRRIQAE